MSTWSARPRYVAQRDTLPFPSRQTGTFSLRWHQQSEPPHPFRPPPQARSLVDIFYAELVGERMASTRYNAWQREPDAAAPADPVIAIVMSPGTFVFRHPAEGEP
jgi:hypothetical protein